MSAVRKPGELSLLLGPYTTHGMALSMVPVGRRLAEQANYRQAAECSFGTVARRGDARGGILNDMLDA